MKISHLIVAGVTALFYVGGYIIAGWLGVLGAILLYWGFVEYILGPLIAVVLRKAGVLDVVQQRAADDTVETLRRFDSRGRFISGRDE